MSRSDKNEKGSHYVKDFEQKRDSVFARFPLLFTLLGAFGAAATFAGFSGIIEQIPLLANNPYIALIAGIVILFLTGKLYKKLG